MNCQILTVLEIFTNTKGCLDNHPTFEGSAIQGSMSAMHEDFLITWSTTLQEVETAGLNSLLYSA